MDFLTEPEKKTPILCDMDVAVVGGGAAGIAASTAAARNGADVLLIDRYGYLGGTVTAGLQTAFQGSDRELISGIYEEVLDKLQEEAATTVEEFHSIRFDGEVFKKIALDMVEKAGVKFLLHSLVVDAVRDGDRIKGVIVENNSGRQAILAKVFIDASGDADVAVKAGLGYQKGCKGFKNYEDGRTQPLTLVFAIGGVDTEKVEAVTQQYQEPVVLWKATDGRQGFYMRRVPDSRGALRHAEDIRFYTLPRKGFVMSNAIHIYGADPTEILDVTAAEVEARHQAVSIVDFLKRTTPGFESCYLADTAVSIGVRESRRIEGEYVLPLEAVEKGLSYDDAVAIGMYHIDIHGPDVIDSGRWDTLPYDIPYRCLLAKGVDNLLAAGRNVSSSFEAQASLRAVPCCFATGQAAGTAAALAVKQGVSPKNLSTNLLQETLVSQGAKILRIVPRHVTDTYKWSQIRRKQAGTR